MEVCFFDGRDNPGGDDVALHDAAKNIHENPFNVAIAKDDFKGGSDLFPGCTAAYIEEIGRTPAIVLDDVHGGHGKARAVDQAGDAPIELDIVKVKFARLDFQGRFLGQVSHLLDFFLPIKRVIIAADLWIDNGG